MPTTQKQTATEFRTETILKIANKKVLAQSDIRELIRHLALGYAEMNDKFDRLIADDVKIAKNKKGFKNYITNSVLPNVASALTVWMFSAIAVAIVIVFFPVFEQMARHVVGLP
jgi:hypothetical protein